MLLNIKTNPSNYYNKTINNHLRQPLIKHFNMIKSDTKKLLTAEMAMYIIAKKTINTTLSKAIIYIKITSNGTASKTLIRNL